MKSDVERTTSGDFGALTVVVFALVSETFPLSECGSPQFYYHNSSSPSILWWFDIDVREGVNVIFPLKFQLVDRFVIRAWGKKSYFWNAKTEGGIQQT